MAFLLYYTSTMKNPDPIIEEFLKYLEKKLPVTTINDQKNEKNDKKDLN